MHRFSQAIEIEAKEQISSQIGCFFYILNKSIDIFQKKKYN